MERNKAENLKAIAAIVTTVGETGEAPEGILYAALMGTMTLDTFQGLMAGLRRAGITESGSMHCVSLTEKGRLLAAQINKALAAPAKKEDTGRDFVSKSVLGLNR